MRWVMLAVVAAGVAMPHVVAACPPGRPCLKYRNRQPATRHELPDRYIRTTKADPPSFERRRVARFLIGSAWKPVYDRPLPKQKPMRGETQIIRDSDTLRFVDPSKTIPDARPGERIVLIRFIEKNKGLTLVDVDGDVRSLAPCKTRKDYACLTVSEIGFADDDPDHPPVPVFSQPDPAAP